MQYLNDSFSVFMGGNGKYEENWDRIFSKDKKMTRYESLRALIEHTSPQEFEDWIREVDNEKTWFGRWLDRIDKGDEWNIEEA